MNAPYSRRNVAVACKYKPKSAKALLISRNLSPSTRMHTQYSVGISILYFIESWNGWIPYLYDMVDAAATGESDFMGEGWHSRPDLLGRWNATMRSRDMFELFERLMPWLEYQLHSKRLIHWPGRSEIGVGNVIWGWFIWNGTIGFDLVLLWNALLPLRILY